MPQVRRCSMSIFNWLGAAASQGGPFDDSLVRQLAASQGGRVPPPQIVPAVARFDNSKARESPRWVPDAESDRCMLCAAEFFGAGLGSRMAGALGLSAANTTSRHHCRYCGWIVCGTCSPEKVAHPSKPGVIGPQVLAVDRWVSSTDGHPIRILEGDVKEKRVCISCLEHAPTEVAERRRIWLSHRRGRE